MKTITKNAANAFILNKSFKGNNTEVIANGAIVGLYLFGNLIAEKNIDKGTTKITNCGWRTATTKERLNGLPNVSISQVKGVWYLNGKQWDGKWTNVPTN